MESDSTGRVIVFTKYPEPGQVKTRLIPFLGAEGAAELHRCMVVHTLDGISRLLAERSLQVDVYFDGGDCQQMAACFGRRWHYVEQVSGDLGARLSVALRPTDKPTVVIGTDCPGLQPTHVHEAMNRLREDDLVIGPANDGGYYLIGINRFHQALFTDIPWGTESVCRITQEIASSLKLSVAMLEELCDIDRPEDLNALSFTFKAAHCRGA
jgi:rSAM/selenodomain-associated transferase 1